MAKREGNQYQIIRQDGRSVFIDFTNDCFQIGKIHLRFARYDLSKPEGNRFLDCIDIYLNFDEWLALANEALSGRMHTRVRKWKVAVEDAEQNNKNSPQPLMLYEKLGGTSADALSRQGKAREDGMSLSRCIKISTGKKDYLFTAQSGPGEQQGKGIIVPRYKTPEHKVTVAMTAFDTDRIFSIVKAHIQGYINSVYCMGINQANNGVA